MRIAQAIAAAAAEIHVIPAGGLHWQVRTVSAEALLAHGAAALPVLSAGGGDDAPAEAPAPSQVEHIQRVMAAWLCAAVCGVSDDSGATWEPIRLVREPGEANPDGGVVCMTDIPLQTRQELIAGARQGASLGESVARFRDRP